MKNYLFTSERLGFRQWMTEDYPFFAIMNADAAVMRFFPNRLTEEASNAVADRLSNHFEEYGFTFFAVDILENEEFIGFIGVIHTKIQAFFTPCIEIGWRLKHTAWGKGLATEGAKACLKYSFEHLGLQEIYAYTPHINIPSENVMQKIGMSKVGTFHYPLLEDNHALNPHLLYRISKNDWLKTR